MKDGRIVEAAEWELFRLWACDLCELMPFAEYLDRMKKLGVAVEDGDKKNYVADK